MTKLMPYQDEFFDAVLAVRVIHHTSIGNITKIVHELDRVLKPKGFLFLQVPSYESGTFDSGTIWAEPGTLIARGRPPRRVWLTISSKETSYWDCFPGTITKELDSTTDHYGGYGIVC